MLGDPHGDQAVQQLHLCRDLGPAMHALWLVVQSGSPHGPSLVDSAGLLVSLIPRAPLILPFYKTLTLRSLFEVSASVSINCWMNSQKAAMLGSYVGGEQRISDTIDDSVRSWPSPMGEFHVGPVIG